MFEITEFFSEEGPLAENLPDFTVRVEQQQLSGAIGDAMADNVSFVCEAGTGTGKTFAYLVPAIQSGLKVIISTGTKNLQDQLFNKDLPIISNSLGIPVNSALLKGRANYICQHRLLEYEKDNRNTSRLFQNSLVDIKQWLTQTETGDLAELSSLPEDSPIKPAVTSTRENCLGQSCDYYEDCFVLKARKNAIEADLVIVNHHLLLADLALRESGFAEVLPKADYIIFDEAHQLPELATEFFAVTLSSRQILNLLTDIRVAWHNDAADVSGLAELLDKLTHKMRQVRLVFGVNDNRVSWQEIIQSNEVQAEMASLIEQITTLEKMLDDLSVRSRSLENCWQRTGHILLLLQDFNSRQSDETIQWLEIRGQGFLLHQTPLDISSVFQTRLAQHECECIYTSATLAVNGNFDHFNNQLGLQDIDIGSWDSPFDYQTQAQLYLPDNMPDPSSPTYTQSVLEASVPVIKASQGHAFILFTSHRALKQVAEQIKNVLDFPVFVQGQAPRNELLMQFRNTRHAVLLGTNSFWEGVDVKGEALSCVIIDKLPFAPPDDPVFKARASKMQEQGLNPFMDYQLPQAIISLKQGVGRLIRDTKDTGVLMICDPRLSSKSYGRKFINSLPKMPKTSDIESVKLFFQNKGNTISNG